jgi:hypothetical protein
MDGLVLPDLTKPLTKKMKEESIKIEKLYSPFMESFFGQNNGAFTLAVGNMVDNILNKLANMFEVMQGLYKESEETNERERRKEDPQKEKKRSWIMEKWQKVIKTGFFQKTLGFLKGMASVDFITQVLTFLLLLRLGIFDRFLPLITSVVGDALESLIRAIPRIIKFIWGMLSEKLPGILKDVFHTALETLGLENEGCYVLADVLSSVLPTLLAIIIGANKLGPIIAGAKYQGFIAMIGSILGMIGTAIIGLLSLFGIVVTLPAWVVGAIAVAIVAIGALIWKFRDEIGQFFSTVWTGLTSLLSGMWGKTKDFFSGMWEGLKGIFFSLIESIAEFISDSWSTYITDPIRKMFRKLWRLTDPVFKKLQPIIDAVSGIFGSIDRSITKMIDSIKSALDSMLDWFSDISSFGAYDWMTMDSKKKQEFQSTRASLRENALVQFASGEISEEEAAKKLGRKDGSLSAQQMAEVQKMRSLQTGEFKNTDIATIIAASMEGVIDKISTKSGSQKRIVNTLTFSKNISATGAKQ